MPLYNHAYTFAFSLFSNHPEGEDVTPDQMRSALLAYLSRCNDVELWENCGCPFDTYQADDAPPTNSP